MSCFSVTVLGSSGSYAGPGNPCTGYLVRSPGACVLLDCGPGTLGPLQAVIDLAELSAIVITHCHPDHWLEIPVLRNVFTFFQTGAALPVYSTAQTREMERAVALPIVGRDEPLVWEVIDHTAAFDLGDQHWEFRLTDHTVETLATRIDVGDRSFMFTSDTGPGWHFTDFGPGLDMVLADASHLAALEGLNIPHLSAREAGVRAREAAVGRLVITHLVPGSDPEAHRAEAEAAYGGPVEVAVPGAVFDI